MSTGNKRLVMVPFAYLPHAKTGANLKKKDDPIDIYMRNAIVATVSCKQKMGGGTDVALVTNTQVKQEYLDILRTNDVGIIFCPFDSFKFPDDYQWCLAFYKLCALKFIAFSDYEQVVCIDSDTFIRGNFDYIWQNMDSGIILYDLAGSTVDPIGSLKRLNFLRLMYNNRVQKVGGEFFAASIENLKPFIWKAEEIFNAMINEKIIVNSGDEYITSLTAACFSNIDYSGVRYIYRFWTGSYRQVCNKGQLSVTPILHVPCAKTDGMIKIYNYFLKNNEFPPEHTLYKWFHFYHKTFKNIILAIMRGTLFWQ